MKSLPPITPELLQRKGARTTAAVPADVRALLAAGRIETANLCEWLVADQASLARVVLAEHGWTELVPRVEAALAALPKPTAPQRMEAIAGVLVEGLGGKRNLRSAHGQLRRHTSDIVRSWAGYLVGRSPLFTLGEKLELVRPLAADSNMGVRETAWFAVRASLAEALEEAFRLLQPWTADPDPNVRRFASEATRPRGVWCRHIEALKSAPELGLPLLTPLRADPSKYVRDSVANWLNDASKSRPEWVRQVCAEWLETSPVDETRYIVRRALRTIDPASTARRGSGARARRPASGR